ncbi:hypothetical protein M407DRAFT_241167, partial [Tulasnella calospora MUT 4182]
MTKPHAAAADQPGTIAASLSTSGLTSESTANLIATHKIPANSASTAMTKSAPGPGPSPSPSAPQSADPPIT